MLWFALLAFIGSGFEHSVANATTFGLAIFQGSADWADLFRNLCWTVPGNIVGGGVVVGLGYAWLANGRSAGDAVEPAVDVSVPEQNPIAEVARSGSVETGQPDLEPVIV